MDKTWITVTYRDGHTSLLKTQTHEEKLATIALDVLRIAVPARRMKELLSQTLPAHSDIVNGLSI